MAVVNVAQPVSEAISDVGRTRLSVAQIIRQTAQKASDDARREVEDAKKLEADFLSDKTGDYINAYNTTKVSKFGNDPRRMSEIIADLGKGQEASLLTTGFDLGVSKPLTVTPGANVGEGEVAIPFAPGAAQVSGVQTPPAVAPMVPETKTDILIKRQMADADRDRAKLTNETEGQRLKWAQLADRQMQEWGSEQWVANMEANPQLGQPYLDTINEYRDKAGMQPLTLGEFKVSLSKQAAANVTKTGAQTDLLGAQKAVAEATAAAIPQRVLIESEKVKIAQQNADRQAAYQQGMLAVAQTNAATSRANATTAAGQLQIAASALQLKAADVTFDMWAGTQSIIAEGQKSYQDRIKQGTAIIGSISKAMLPDPASPDPKHPRWIPNQGLIERYEGQLAGLGYVKDTEGDWQPPAPPAAPTPPKPEFGGKGLPAPGFGTPDFGATPAPGGGGRPKPTGKGGGGTPSPSKTPMADFARALWRHAPAGATAAQVAQKLAEKFKGKHDFLSIAKNTKGK